MSGWLAGCMVIVFLMCKNINMHTYYTYYFFYFNFVSKFSDKIKRKKNFLRLLMLIKKISNSSIVYQMSNGSIVYQISIVQLFTNLKNIKFQYLLLIINLNYTYIYIKTAANSNAYLSFFFGAGFLIVYFFLFSLLCTLS